MSLSLDFTGLRCRGAPAHSHDAAEPHVARRRVDRLGEARGGPVAAAVVRRAQVRAALEHLAGDSDLRLAWVVAALLARPARVGRDAARLLTRGGVSGPIPIG